MAFKQKPNTGSLWPNDRKQKPTDADRTGSINIDGKEYWLNGWINKAKDGRTYMGLTIKPKQRDGGLAKIGGDDDLDEPF